MFTTVTYAYINEQMHIFIKICINQNMFSYVFKKIFILPKYIFKIII